MSQLEPLDLIDFTGGLNIRRTEFNLGENESPEMLNIEIDPRGGIFTRYGWERYNDADIVADPATWDPRIATIAVDQNGAFNVYIANGTTVYKTDQAGDSVDIGAEVGETAFSVGGSIHLADFAEWGDAVYIAAGLANPSVKRDESASAGSKNTILGRTYNDDYTTPTNGNMPQAEHVEPHGSYLFVASVDEVLDINGTGSGVQRSRLRWSHPSKQEDWATNDYIDIEIGGGTITGLMSFRDHLLIFKTDSIWRLYGYDSTSFQLDKVSRSVGVPTPSAATRSETAVFFYSASQRGGIFAYDGGSPVELSQRIAQVLEAVTNTQYPNVWLGWVGRRLWCSLPYDESGSTDVQSVFVFDPDVGGGSWVRHSTSDGNLTCIIEGSDVEANAPLAVIDGTSGTSAIVQLGKIDDAYDTVLTPEGYAVFLTDSDGNRLVESAPSVPATDVYLTESDSYLPGAGFDTLYRTRWLHAGWPERRKSWRRPRFAVTQQNQSVQINVMTNWDYRENDPRRQHVLGVDPQGSTFWRALGFNDPAPGGFDWTEDGVSPPGALWGQSGASGSELERAPRSGGSGLGGLGVARSVQLEFTTSPLTPARKWGINAMFLKYKTRRYTT